MSWTILDPASPDPVREHQLRMNRRHFFGRSALGIGGAALATLFGQDGLLAASPQSATAAPGAGKNALGLPHFAPKAKRVIYLFQNGAPTHIDIFDYKPKLHGLHGKKLPAGYAEGKRFSTMTKDVADKLMLHAVNHAPAIAFLLSGGQIPGRPTLGAWLNYGLGSPASELPGFVAMTSVSKGTSCGQIFYDFYWGAGFLPSRFQGSKFRGSKDPVLYLKNPAGMPPSLRRSLLDDLAELNHMKFEEAGDPEIQTRIAQYEMAYKMQTSVPDLTDFSDEPEHVLDMYGPQVREPGTFAYNCLMARRLAERGVPYVQCMHAGWDQHNSITTELYTQCKDTDQPSAALVKDLKMRGLLDDTAGAATTTPTRSRCGWPVAAASPESATARPTISASTRWKTKSMSTTSKPPCYTCSGSTTKNSPTVSKAVTSGSRMCTGTW